MGQPVRYVTHQLFCFRVRRCQASFLLAIAFFFFFFFFDVITCFFPAFEIYLPFRLFRLCVKSTDVVVTKLIEDMIVFSSKRRFGSLRFLNRSNFFLYCNPYCVLCPVFCVCTVCCVLCAVCCGVLCCVLCVVRCVLCTVYCLLGTFYCVLCTEY